MQVYARVITKREPTNKFGKLGFVEHTEVLINPTDDILKEANYKKHIRFKPFAVSNDFNSLDKLKTALTEHGFNNVDILYKN